MTVFLFMFFIVSNLEALDFVVKSGDFKEDFYFQGELSVKKKAVLRVPEAEKYSAYTVKNVVKEGVFVKKGQVVLEFEDSDLIEAFEDEKSNLKLKSYSLKTAELELKKEEAKRKNALDRKILELKKAKLLLINDNSDLMPKIEQEKAKLEIKSANLSLKQAQKLVDEFKEYEDSKLSIAKLNKEKTQKEVEKFQRKIEGMKLKSPSDGLLFYPYTKQSGNMSKIAKGSVVDMGDLLLEVPDLSSFEAHVYVRQSESAQVKIGDLAKLSLEVDPANEISAKLVKIARFATTRNERLGEKGPASKLKEVKLTFEIEGKEDYFTPGLSLQAKVTSLKKKSCIYIPWIYILERQDKYFVQINALGKLVEREISLGTQGNVFTEVVSGLNENEIISTFSE
ncbi:MAG: HlyD family efflux transporter periplasmic adaptor subunit [Candidatus Cloacimonetes bacterium]|nr:HlyD family efflux transporter periplasmic adaptor subunit [Candidatus Cloacimonadota bacterium]